jgi:hypothetical protein
MKKNPVLIALGKNVNELRDIRLNSRRYEFGNGVYCDLRMSPNGGIIIDRLFVPEDLRGRRLHKNMLRALVRLAGEANIKLSMSVAPDRLEGEALDAPRYNKVTDALVLSAMELGFKPDRDGEDVYRLDLTYKLGICRDKKNKTGDIGVGPLLASAHELTGRLFKKHHG